MYTFNSKVYKTKSGMQSGIRAAAEKIAGDFEPARMRANGKMLIELHPETAARVAYQEAVNWGARQEKNKYGRKGFQTYGFNKLCQAVTQSAEEFYGGRLSAYKKAEAERQKAEAKQAKKNRSAALMAVNGIA